MWQKRNFELHFPSCFQHSNDSNASKKKLFMFQTSSSSYVPKLIAHLLMLQYINALKLMKSCKLHLGGASEPMSWTNKRLNRPTNKMNVYSVSTSHVIKRNASDREKRTRTHTLRFQLLECFLFLLSPKLHALLVSFSSPSSSPSSSSSSSFGSSASYFCMFVVLLQQ